MREQNEFFVAARVYEGFWGEFESITGERACTATGPDDATRCNTCAACRIETERLARTLPAGRPCDAIDEEVY